VSGYCTVADVLLAGNSQLGAQLVDYDKDGTADVGVGQWHIDTASYLIRSIAIARRPDYKSLADLAVATFDPATTEYQGLRRNCAWLAFDLSRGAYRNNMEGIHFQHPIMVWAGMVRDGAADLT